MTNHNTTSPQHTIYRPAPRWQCYTFAFNGLCLFFISGTLLAVFATPNELLVKIFVVIACIVVLGFAILHNYHYGPVHGKVRLITSPDGIFYQGPGYAIFAPWKYVIGFGEATYGTYKEEGLLLRRIPVREQKAIKDEAHRLVASITVSPWLRRGERLLPLTEAIAPHRIPDKIRIVDYAQSIPVGAFARGKNWRESPLGDEIRRYVPHIFKDN